MDQLNSARAQMGISLAFHIVFAALGVGLPLMMCIAEGIGLFRRDQVWYALARRWSIAFTILYAIGAVSGTILEFELGLLWPYFMKFSGAIIGLPFALEAFAFFIEGIFLGLYLFGWKRLSPLAHWLCSWPLWIGGLASSMFVVSANAWMNTPSGFQMRNGQLVGIDPIGAILNPSMPSETFHMTLAAYEVTAFGIATVYAISLLRGHITEYTKRGFFLGIALGTIVAPVQIWVGDVNAEIVADYQPIKLAAMELNFKTQTCAPEVFGGIPHGHSVAYALQVPCLLSWLGYHDINHPVLGLDSVPTFYQPPYQFVHVGWQLMLFFGISAAVMTAWFWFFYGRNVWRNWRTNAKSLTDDALPLYGLIGKLTLWGGILLGPATFIAMECGWMVTEMGRQPWTVYGYVLTANAVQVAPWLNISFIVFSGVYVLLGLTTTLLLLRLGQQTRKAAEPKEMIAAGGALE